MARGLVLIIGAWNYPLMLLIDPLVGAIAAGNAAVVKPSEISSQTAKLIAEHLPLYLDGSCFAVVCGEAEETAWLARCNLFDFIFFTGSPHVGKLIYQAAATNLTPVLLELGGKSPCLLTASADERSAPQRIVWGKLFNAGQSCIAPDYLILIGTPAERKKMLDGCVKATKGQFHSQTGLRIGSCAKESLSRIVSTRHFERLVSMLLEIPSKWIVLGGTYDAASLYFEPTLIEVPSTADFFGLTLAKEEIFGPILPIISVDSFDDAIALALQLDDHPLAAYLFSKNQAEQTAFQQKITSGSICLNDVMLQFQNDNLPFGGIGSSGIGSYHGKATFDAFSHHKSVLSRSTADEFVHERLRYAPYKAENIPLLGRLFYRGKDSFTSLLKGLFSKKTNKNENT